MVVRFAAPCVGIACKVMGHHPAVFRSVRIVGMVSCHTPYSFAVLRQDLAQADQRLCQGACVQVVAWQEAPLEVPGVVVESVDDGNGRRTIGPRKERLALKALVERVQDALRALLQ